MRKSTLDQVQSLTRELVAHEGTGDEAAALRVQAKLDQLTAKAERTKQPYDVFAKHAHFGKFGTTKKLWEQARRCVHSDTSGTSGATALARKVEAILVDDQKSGASTTATAFRIARLAKADEASHNLAIRNQIAELENEDALRELLAETDGDLPKAKALADATKVRWAPVYASEAGATATGGPSDDLERHTHDETNVDSSHGIDDDRTNGVGSDAIDTDV